MNLENFLIVSAAVFAIGLYGTISKRNVITVLMSIELMLNAVNIAAVAFSRYLDPSLISQGTDVTRSALTGQIFSLFIITVAAAEIALGIAIIITVYRNRETVFITDVNQMRH